MRAVQFAIIIIIGLSFLDSPLLAQGPKPATPISKPATETGKPPISPATTHELTATDLDSFLDGVMPLQLAREDIAGAVVLVVKDGKVLFAKGYGYSDVSKRAPVSPEGTLFRPGSISKLFTWTAVMQQVEQGKIDLDRDVNDYLDFKIEPKFGKPVTMRNIMTHTAGFEETAQDLITHDPKKLTSLGDYLKTHQPQRIFPPGTTPAYSNYATSLAGYIVERVSGMPFNDYVEKNIFIPLGMNHSSFRQPLPDALKPMMSSGYARASEPAKPYELVQPYPAGSLAAPATDMARLMLTHLQDGQLDGKQILRPETARLMHARAFENHPAMNAMALGFYEESAHGHRIIGHGGDTEYFHSDLHLILDSGVGFFVSYNSAGKGEVSPREALWRAFLNRYYPYEPPATPTVASAAEDAKTVSGRYLVSRRSETNFLRALSVIGDLKVSANQDGTISADMFKDLSGEPKHFKEVGPLLFRAVNDQDQFAFKRTDSGDLRMVIDYPFMVFDKAHGSNDSQVLLVILIFSLSGLVLTVLLWPIGALLRRHYGKKLELNPGLRLPRLVTRLVCLFDLIFAAAITTFVVKLLSDLDSGAGLQFLVRFGQLLGALGVVGTLVALYYAYKSWTNSGRGIWSKLGDSFTALACMGFTWFAIAFHLLSFSLRY
jgi:CubicO group peptidase (beta-lactamase class C family)